MLTGLTAIDVLAPLGRGQSMMVVGPEDSTASDLCLDVLLSQQDTGVSAIYVAMRPVDEMATIATQANCVAVSSSSVGEFAASVAAACALGEAVRDTGKHVCIVVDDMQRGSRVAGALFGSGPGLADFAQLIRYHLQQHLWHARAAGGVRRQ
jgi:F-type H+-transporting ATPase subunit alpha